MSSPTDDFEKLIDTGLQSLQTVNSAFEILKLDPRGILATGYIAGVYAFIEAFEACVEYKHQEILQRYVTIVKSIASGEITKEQALAIHREKHG